VAVLRQCDEACVRELAVQCVMQVCGGRIFGISSVVDGGDCDSRWLWVVVVMRTFVVVLRQCVWHVCGSWQCSL
jgi:hypothetical protein